MAYCPDCGYGIGSQGHHDCCVEKTSTYTRNGNRINMRDIDYEMEDHLREEMEEKQEEINHRMSLDWSEY